MTTDSDAPVTINYFIEPGYIFVATKPAVISGVLGSCVSVCLFDRELKIGGMNNFRFPFIKEKNMATAVYGNVATLALIRMMLNEGSEIKNLEAQILGGAYNSELSPQNIGKENILTAKKILTREGVRIASEDVGGEKGRKVIFNTSNNEIAVMKVDKLRLGDWYPYENNP